MTRTANLSDDIRAFFSQKIPEGWYADAVTITVDRDEIMVCGPLEAAGDPQTFREATRDARVTIARQAEHRYERKVSWAVVQDGIESRFSPAAVPAMTRLRMEERQVLDTLIEGGIARSRSEALAWCVRQVGEAQQEWMDELRDAAAEVERIRTRGPQPKRP